MAGVRFAAAELAAANEHVEFSAAEIAALRPSEYTAALIQGLHARAEQVRRGGVLEIGSGSGVVLAAMAQLGATSLCGVDIEAAAVASGTRLLQRLGYDREVEIHRGDMWTPVAGRRFAAIAANLPQFPMQCVGYAGRLPSWSSGGLDGRRLLDRFVGGLAAHLAPGGCAVITHNGFVGLARTRALAVGCGLSVRVMDTVLVNLPADKLALMTPAIRCAEEGRSIHTYGPYAFAEMHVVEITAGPG